MKLSELPYLFMSLLGVSGRQTLSSREEGMPISVCFPRCCCQTNAIKMLHVVRK